MYNLNGTTTGYGANTAELANVDIRIGNSAVPSNGIYSPGTDQLAISTGGTGRLFVDSLGRVGIGLTTARSNFINGTVSSALQVEGAGGASPPGRFLSITYGKVGSNNGPYIILAKHRSDSIGGITAVAANDFAGHVSFTASDGTNFLEVANIHGAVDGTPGLNDMPGRLVFSTTADGAASPTEAMRINNQRELLIGTTTRTANGGVLQVSNGITFPGTQSACSDPNTLDDYEEGTFTPTVIGLTTAGTGTYTVQSGKYVKVGGKVHVEVAMTWTAHTGTGNMQFSGLPFTSSTTGNGPGVAFGRISNIALTANNLLLGFVSSNSTVIPLRQYAVGGSAEAAVPIDTAGEVNFSVEYMVV